MPPMSWPKAKSAPPTRRASENSSPKASSASTCTKCASRWRRPASSMSMKRKIEVAMRLRTLLGDHPGTAALKNGTVKSDLVEFDFVEYSPTNKGLNPMVREGAWDV